MPSDDFENLPALPDEQPVLNCSVRRTGHAIVVSVQAELDLVTVPEFGRTLTAVRAAATGPVVLDLSGVTFLDSSGINALVLATRDTDTPLRIVATSPTVAKTIRLAGAHELLDLAPTLEAALADAERRSKRP